MWGKDYIVTIQAINKNHKMSLVSEPAVFKVASAPKEVKTSNSLVPIT